MKKTVVLLYLILGINSLEAQSLPKPELDQKPVPPQDCDDTKLEVGFKDTLFSISRAFSINSGESVIIKLK